MNVINYFQLRQTNPLFTLSSIVFSEDNDNVYDINFPWERLHFFPDTGLLFFFTNIEQPDKDSRDNSETIILTKVIELAYKLL